MTEVYTNKIIFENTDEKFSKQFTDHLLSFHMEINGGGSAILNFTLRDSLVLNGKNIFTSLIDIKNNSVIEPFVIQFVTSFKPYENNSSSALVCQENSLLSYSVSQKNSKLSSYWEADDCFIVHHIKIASTDVTFGEYKKNAPNSQTDDN